MKFRTLKVQHYEKYKDDFKNIDRLKTVLDCSQIINRYECRIVQLYGFKVPRNVFCTL